MHDKIVILPDATTRCRWEKAIHYVKPEIGHGLIQNETEYKTVSGVRVCPCQQIKVWLSYKHVLIWVQRPGLKPQKPHLRGAFVVTTVNN